MRIGIKLTIAFFLVAFISMLVIGYISYTRGRDSLEKESFNHLTAVREMKATQIEDYFKLIHDQVQTFANDRMIVRAAKKFKEGFDKVQSDLKADAALIDSARKSVKHYFETEYLPRLNKNLDKPATFENESVSGVNGILLQHLYLASNINEVGKKDELNHPGDSSEYTKTHNQIHPVIRDYLKTFGYYDIFIVDDKTGNIVYSVFKEVDYGTSLLDGPFNNTNLADAFRSVHKSVDKSWVKLVDFKPYHPSYNAPASFIAAPIYDNGERIAVLIFQMPIDRINNIMTNKLNWKSVGLGESGESYIVGDDFTLRNQSRFLIEDPKNYFKMIRDIGTPKSTVAKIENFQSSIGLQEVRTEGTKAAIAGETGTKIFPDYRGVPVLSAYKPLQIEGMNWVIMSEIDESEAFAHVYSLRTYIMYGFFGLLLLVVLASFIISRQMTRPIKELTYDAKELAKGNFDVELHIKSKDEIGVLAMSFKKMQRSIKNLIEELKDINHNLENKVLERTKEIHHQKEIVEEKNKEIVDSINYAERLQRAILPTYSKVKEHLPDSFVLFKPKDIVSGDFYWMHTHGGQVMIAAVDCTGHGVPGAMVSVVGANSLDRCVKEFGLKKPSSVLDKLTDLVIETFETSEHEVKDGMDITLCSIDMKERKIQFAAANNPLWILHHETKELEEIKADKQPIGKFDHRKEFTNHNIQLKKGDCIYLFSDGYADQFGGPNGKKFKYKTMQNLLIEIHEKPMEDQREILNREFEKWRGMLEQIDDVCVIGIRL